MALSTKEIRDFDFVTLNPEIMDPANDYMESKMFPLAISRHRVLNSSDYGFSRAKHGIFSQTYLDSVAFVALNESNPPKEKILAAAERSGAPPLATFIRRVWGPEEGEDLTKGGHGEILGEAAVAYGALSRQQLNDERAEMFKRVFPLGEGYGVIGANTYGHGQERFTQYFYGSELEEGIEQVRESESNGKPLLPLKPQERKGIIEDNPILQVFYDLILQEAFHAKFYLEYLKAIWRSIREYDPRLVKGFRSMVAQTLAELQMPGRVMVPDRYEDINKKADEIGFSIFPPLKQIANDLRPIMGYRGLGEAALGYVDNDPEKLVPQKFDKLHPVVRILHEINKPIVNSFVGWGGIKYLSHKAKAA